MSASVRRHLHFRHYFHPAGHGTFFTGHIRRDGAAADDFVWIYDCGSRSWRHLSQLVDRFVASLGPRSFIDMVCLSHFDSDHVNGIEALLDRAAVGTLVLPYLSIEARLALAADLSASAPSAHRVAALIADPTRYLVERGLSERTERVVLVKGGSAIGEDGVVVHREPRDVRSEGEVDVGTRAPGVDEVGYQDAGNVGIAEHRESWLLGGVYEVTFYNSALARSQAPISGASLQDIANELADIITGYGLCESAAPARGWIGALRTLYGRHFGSRPRQKNDISLCALGRPLVAGSPGFCRKFERDIHFPALTLSLVDGYRNAILLTGDISLDSSELDQIRRHVGPSRWSAIGLMQVPHHGSLRSWELGLSGSCVHDHSVICAAPSRDHPHADVERDLVRRNPVLASCTQAVTFDYHVRC